MVNQVRPQLWTALPRLRRGGRGATGRPALLLVALAVTLPLGVTGCGGQQDSLPTAGREVRGTTMTAELQVVPLTVSATGNLEAEKSINLSTRMMGWIRTIHVDEGQRVQIGDPLISIDGSDLVAKKAQTEAAIVEAKAVLANAEKMVERFQKLYAEKSISKQQLDDAVTGRDRAVAGLKAAEAMHEEVSVNLTYLDIAAPVSGVVIRKMIEVGDMANPGVPLLILEKNDRMKVVARLGEKHVNLVKVGDVVTVDVTSLPGARFQVPLTEIIQTANPGSRTYDIEAYVDNADGRLKSGMFARVEVAVGERETIVVPTGSIISRGQLRGVFVVSDEGVAHLRWIRLGRRISDGVEVLAGLEGGETIVVSSDQPLIEGDRVVR